MIEAFFWMTHGHRPQQAALLAVKRAFGDRIGTVGSRIDGRMDHVPADLVLAEPKDDRAFVDMIETHARDLRSRTGDIPVVVLAMHRRRELLAEAESLSRAGVVLLAGSADTEMLDLCEDKYRFAEFMRVAFPAHALQTHLVINSSGLEAAVVGIEATGAEACVKPPIGVFGRGFWHLSRKTPPSAMFTGSPDFEERRKVCPDLFRAAYAADPKPLVVMPFLAGTEISVDALFRGGELLRAATRRKNGSLQAIAEDAEEVLPVLRPMGQRLRLDGIINVQVRRATDAVSGPYKVLEINTRYSGGSAYLIDAGIDLFSGAVASVIGREQPRLPVVPLLDVAVRAEPARKEARWRTTS